MLRREAEIQLARDVGLAAQADRLSDTVRPGRRLDLDPGADPSRPGTTKVGGSANDAWRGLLELHHDERIGLEILDGGAYTVLAPVAGLAAGRYDRLVRSVDSS